MSMNAYITEVFNSIQGEGLWTGVPATFIRFAGCNLRCPWCDTPGSLDRAAGRPRTVENLAREINAMATPRVILTGGEPLMQPEAVHALGHALRKPVHLETNGTMPIIFQSQLNWVVVSPKPPDYIIDRSLCLVPFEIKIVVTVDMLPDKLVRMVEGFLKTHSSSWISLQPVNANILVAKSVINLMINNHWGKLVRLSLQLHKVIGVR